MGSVIETSRDGRVLVIELTRPNQLNALNSEVLSLLREAVESEQRESSIGLRGNPRDGRQGVQRRC